MRGRVLNSREELSSWSTMCASWVVVLTQILDFCNGSVYRRWDNVKLKIKSANITRPRSQGSWPWGLWARGWEVGMSSTCPPPQRDENSFWLGTQHSLLSTIFKGACPSRSRSKLTGQMWLIHLALRLFYSQWLFYVLLPPGCTFLMCLPACLQSLYTLIREKHMMCMSRCRIERQSLVQLRRWRETYSLCMSVERRWSLLLIWNPRAIQKI